MPGRRLRFVAWSLVGVLVLGAVYVGATFVQVWRASTLDQTRDVDAIVVLGAAQYDGAPSPVFERRLRHAFDLYEAGHAEVIVTTGSKAEGDRFTEGFAGYDFLRSLGVPDAALLVVVDGRNTWEQLSATDAVLAERGLDSVLLVSDSYHSYRATLIAESVGLDAYSSPSGGETSFDELARETAGVSLGRLFGFRRLSNLR